MPTTAAQEHHQHPSDSTCLTDQEPALLPEKLSSSPTLRTLLMPAHIVLLLFLLFIIISLCATNLFSILTTSCIMLLMQIATVRSLQLFFPWKLVLDSQHK